MTTVEVLYRYTSAPTEAVALALGSTHDVYGIRRIQMDSAAQTLRVEYDATRLNTATVTNLVRSTGLQISEELPLIPAQPEPEAVEKA
jgi:hypothetical protein